MPSVASTDAPSGTEAPADTDPPETDPPVTEATPDTDPPDTDPPETDPPAEPVEDRADARRSRSQALRVLDCGLWCVSLRESR